MTQEQKDRLVEIDKQIAELLTEKEAINPFSNLKNMNNKTFGEEFSEPFIISKCPNLIKDNSAGHDVRTVGGELWEIKSCRLPLKKITFNQCHPLECDKFLFALYDTEEGDVLLYLIPSKDIELFAPTSQHIRGSMDCCSVSWGVKKRRDLEEKYRIESFERLSQEAANGKDTIR